MSRMCKARMPLIVCRLDKAHTAHIASTLTILTLCIVLTLARTDTNTHSITYVPSVEAIVVRIYYNIGKCAECRLLARMSKIYTHEMVKCILGPPASARYIFGMHSIQSNTVAGTDADSARNGKLRQSLLTASCSDRPV